MRTPFWGRAALACVAGIWIHGSLTVPAIQTSEDQTTSARVSPENFIAAFDLTPKKDFCFTWPPESMRPAPYNTVVLVVETMPQAREAKPRDGQLTPLRARDYLRVNGQPPGRLPRIAGQGSSELEQTGECFLVRLDHGRFTVRLLVPPSLTVDRSHDRVRIKLYRHFGTDQR